ncbi:hypothetical protein GCM10022403_041140 [Streptomyces coacervatus]|uniref:Uncharacterized protein n=1 Tax=Streptomyces coacervatus TaxID=647381 RepID=A0ABP7HUU6_9ACTN|nr:hypothetical protein [Streptomyces coacervatus]MDF2267300.1 hypothetical protein [Streptomyces coacervatus]
MGDVRLAATWTPNPNHPATWGGFFAMLVVTAGCVIIFAGLLAAFATWRSTEQPRYPGLWRVLLGTAGCFTVVGLVIIAFGVWLY